MATILDTLITKFRFESDRAGLEKVSIGLSQIQSKILKIGASIFAVLSGGALLSHVAKNVDEMGKFADSIGISVQQLQALDYAANRTGVPITTLHTSLLELNKVVGEAARGYGIYGQVLARFGVAIRSPNGQILNTFQLLTELNRVFQNLAPSQQFDLAQNIGINAETVKLLQQTPKTFDALIKRSRTLGQFTSLNAIQAAKFEDSLVDLRTSFFELGVELGASIFPALTRFINFLTSSAAFLRKNNGLIKAVSIAVGILSAAFTLMRTRAAIAWAVAFAPITAAIASLTALILVINDIWVAFKGGKSIIGDFIKNSKIIRAIWGAIKKDFEALVNLVNKFEKIHPAFNKFVHQKAPTNKQLGVPTADSFLTNLTPLAKTQNTKGSITTTHHATTVNLGGVTINSTNGNAQQISDAVTNRLKNEFKNSVTFFDSGIAR